MDVCRITVRIPVFPCVMHINVLVKNLPIFAIYDLIKHLKHGIHFPELKHKQRRVPETDKRSDGLNPASNLDFIQSDLIRYLFLPELSLINPTELDDKVYV